MNLPSHIELLRQMIAIPSRSREEDGTAALLYGFLDDAGARPERFRNNVMAITPDFDPSRPTLLLNSHHDTVRPAASYTRDPYSPVIEDGDRLFGLGSNDAGGSVVALLATFLAIRGTATGINLILAITAEEEVGGENGMRAFLPWLHEKGISPDMAIVGEPTGMLPAVAERGLVVLDCLTTGVTGHAARGEGINAIYRAMADIERIRNFAPPSVSGVLGPIGINVTQIEAGWQHNAIPDKCKWVTDIRTTDAYTNEQTVEMVRALMSPHTTVTPRSTRVRASVIPATHPLVRSASSICGDPFVSPTTSDMSLMYDIPSLKIGPGQSSRSHSADEYILISEIEDAVEKYRLIIESLQILNPSKL